MSSRALIETAQALVASPRGLLAADESTPTMTRRLAAHNIASSEWVRRDWRELLITTPETSRWISGVILFDETARQLTSLGEPFPAAITDRGMIAGIKVDTGAQPHGDAGEKLTDGLDGLKTRLEQYRRIGLRFAKWRAVIVVDRSRDLPTPECIELNNERLARYAAACQRAGLVPIVEPEVLSDGDHSRERCEQITTDVLRSLFAALDQQDVQLEATVLKANMVLAGTDHATVETDDDIARSTLATLRSQAPLQLAGIVFLSGGQTPAKATSRLAAINGHGPQPWPLTFSYGRALQQEALAAWRGDPANAKAAQDAFARRAEAASDARTTRAVQGEAA